MKKLKVLYYGNGNPVTSMGILHRDAKNILEKNYNILFDIMDFSSKTYTIFNSTIFWKNEIWKAYDIIMCDPSLALSSYLTEKNKTKEFINKLVPVYHTELDINSDFFNAGNTKKILDYFTTPVCAINKKIVNQIKEKGNSSQLLPVGINDKKFKPFKKINKIKKVGFIGSKDTFEEWSKIKRPKLFDDICKKANVEPIYINGKENNFQMYEDIDLIICTSTIEGNPMAFLECAASKIPFISTKVGIVNEYKEVKTFNTIDEAVELINELNENKDNIQEYVNKLYNVIIPERKWENVLEKYWVPYFNKLNSGNFDFITTPISVVMPVYNTKPEWIEESIISIINQTYSYFELIIVNDGSTNIDTIKYLENIDNKKTKYTDDRIKLINLKENIGISGALNVGIEEAKYEWIARQDADDISLNDRFEKQMNYLHKNPKVDLISSSLHNLIFKNDEWVVIDKWKKEGATSHKSNIDKEFLKNSNSRWFTNHPSAIFKKSIWEAAGRYDESLRGLPEDYDLWVKMLVNGALFHNMKESLYYYRSLEDSLSKNFSNEKSKWFWNKHIPKLKKKLFIKDMKHELKEYEHLLETDNWFNYAHLYSDVVRNFPNFKNFVEVGCWKGHSISYLAELLKSREGVKISAVDVWDDGVNLPGYIYLGPNEDNEVWKYLYSIYNENLTRKGVRDLITDYKQCSWEGAENFEDESIDFCFIDAGHAYEEVIKDIDAYLPKMKKTGIIAGHDYYNQTTGVRKAVDEKFNNNVNSSDGICWWVYMEDL